MYKLKQCDDHENCASYEAAEAGGNCTICGLQRIPPGFEEVIRGNAVEVMSNDLKKRRQSNPDRATADAANEARHLYPRLKDPGGKI